MYHHRRLRKGLTALMAVLGFSAACDQSDSAPPRFIGKVPNLSLDMPSSPRGIGRRAEVWTDVQRQRRLPVWIYYPTDRPDSTGEPVLSDSAWAALHRQEIDSQYGIAAATGLARLRTHALTDAPISVVDGPPPVLIFVPGLGALPTDYTGLIEQVVSRGFAVVTFAAPHGPAVVRYADGAILAPGTADEQLIGAMADDINFLRGQLIERMQDGNWPLVGRLNITHIAVFGHGLGGSAAFLAAMRDSTLSAAISLNGDFPGEVAHGGARQPLLYVTVQPNGVASTAVEEWAKTDRTERNRADMWATVSAASQHALHARVVGLLRGNFTDAAMLPATALPPAPPNTRVGRIEPQRGFALIASLVAGFAADVLSRSSRGMEAAALVYPEVKLEVLPAAPTPRPFRW